VARTQCSSSRLHVRSLRQLWKIHSSSDNVIVHGLLQQVHLVTVALIRYGNARDQDLQSRVSTVSTLNGCTRTPVDETHRRRLIRRSMMVYCHLRSVECQPGPWRFSRRSRQHLYAHPY
jgi:hypothetical protein